ncbi:hypothetical protein [Leptospira ilyithenensis]|nr:hypothetical protein [Leptospira ilyithenensis]
METQRLENKMEDVHSLGWSKDGALFVYRTFSNSNAITSHSNLTVKVVDIVSDNILGYFLNPKRDRIAILIKESRGEPYLPDYFIVGCSLGSGFKK